MAAHDASRRWREADAIAKRLVDVYDVSLDEHLSHQIISIAGRAGNMAHARAAFDRMRSARVGGDDVQPARPRRWAGTRRNGDWDGAGGVGAWTNSSPRTSGRTRTRTRGLGERGGARGAVRGGGRGVATRARVQDQAAHGDVRAYVHCLGCQGRWMEAEALVAQMREKWGARRNAAVYNAQPGALVRGKSWTRRSGRSTRCRARTASSRRRSRSMLAARAPLRGKRTRARAKELAAVRDALAETGALENDFSKYDANRNGPGNGPGERGEGEERRPGGCRRGYQPETACRRSRIGRARRER